MYAYVVSLHPLSGTKPVSQPTLAPTPIREVPNLQLRSTPFNNTEYEEQFSGLRGVASDSVIGFQVFWLTEVLEPNIIATALADYYAQIFPKLTFMDGESYVGSANTPTPFTVAVDRVDIPSSFTREWVEKEIMQFNIRDLPPLKFAFSGPDAHSLDNPTLRVNSSLAVPPAFLKTSQRLELFTQRLKAWAAAETAKEGWIRGFTEVQQGDLVGAADEDIGGCNYASAFEGGSLNPTRTAQDPPVKSIVSNMNKNTAYVFDIPKRWKKASYSTMTAAMLRLWKGKPTEEWEEDTTALKFDRVLLPCTFTPFLNTVFCPEIAVQKIEAAIPAADGSKPFLRTDTYENFSKAVAVSQVAAVSRFQHTTLAAKAVLAPSFQLPTGSAGSAAATAGLVLADSKLAKFPHAQQLSELWKLFTTEYVQRKAVATSDAVADCALPSGPEREKMLEEVTQVWNAATPTKPFLAAWKLFALRPKASGLATIEHFANTPVGPKPLPVNWEKEVTPELLTEWFYELKGEVIAPHGNKVAFLTPILTQKMRILVDSIFRKKVPINYSGLTPEAYAELDSLDYNVALEILMGQTLSEASRTTLVAAFIREEVQHPVEGAVVGSAELHAHFTQWLRSATFFTSIGATELQALQAQFPITEFSRLMKAAGFEMTRRSRGMVYLNATITKTPGAAEASVLPIDAKHEPANLTGEAKRIAFTNGCNTEATLENYIKQRDAVCAEQEAIVTGKLPSEAGTLLSDLDGLDATEPNYAAPV